MTQYYNKSYYDLYDNKNMIINSVDGIDIENFRKFNNQKMNLSKNITVVSGRNGTLKSTLMGLIFHPFTSDKKDVHEKSMMTKFSDVFKMSTEKDTTEYKYSLKMNIDDDLLLKEPVNFYLQSSDNRHRIVPSGRKTGDGFFLLPSIYINLRRLYPLIDSGKIKPYKIEYSEQESAFIASFYEKILLRDDFKNFETFETDAVKKNTVGPKDSYFDINTISSGEDNLSSFVNSMISLMRIYDKNQRKKLTGILAIDEFEASLHPIAQANLFDFLVNWSEKYRVQIIINTHSLYLIQHILSKKKYIEKDYVKLNFITNRFQADNQLTIVENPNYKYAVTELTLREDEDLNDLLKIKILCEDKTAINYIKKIVKNRKILNLCKFECTVDTENVGTSWGLLQGLGKNYPNLLHETNSILVFDGDVIEENLKLNKFNEFLIIPSNNKLPLEKEIVNYILSLSGDDKFFKQYQREKDSFKQQFKRFSIPLNPDNISDIPTKVYKEWATNNQNDFNKYSTYFVNQNIEQFQSFKDNFKNHVNFYLKKNNIKPID
ncbi:AAA family ATPase [Enterococcus casseliflavus]|uniref:AAA family ATPase n=1 Tax=Enterococcus casseliflavus TaxID=37734 RepID=UPI0039A66C5D